MKTKCLITPEQMYDLAYYHIRVFRYWEGKSTTYVRSNKDHSVYYYGRVLPGRYEEVNLFEITGEYAKMLWATECYLNSVERCKEI